MHDSYLQFIKKQTCFLSELRGWLYRVRKQSVEIQRVFVGTQRVAFRLRKLF